MNKMTDEEIRKRDAIYSELQNAPEDDFENGMRECRNFYDAQIDAQTKTMEELLVLYQKAVCKKHEEWGPILDWYNANYKELKLYVEGQQFADAVLFYLAAGGVIKE